jgi:hypothetical protein
MVDEATKGFGQQDPSDSVGPYNPYAFVISQKLARISTVKIVKVLAVDTDAHTVDVQIAVNQLDGQNNATPHGTIYGIPYACAMGGKNAFMIDPVVNDMGVMVVNDRDISSVKKNKDISNPGSLRKFSPSDGVYLFSIPSLNGAAPEQWIKFLPDGGINLTDKFGNVQQTSNAGISINGVMFNRSGQIAGNLPVTGSLQLSGSVQSLNGSMYTGDIKTSGDVVAGSIGLKGHHHTAQGATAPTTIAQP